MATKCKFFEEEYKHLLLFSKCLKRLFDFFLLQGGEVPARTALGATTVLSIVNLGFGGKSKPKVKFM